MSGSNDFPAAFQALQIIALVTFVICRPDDEFSTSDVYIPKFGKRKKQKCRRYTLLIVCRSLRPSY